MPAGLNVTPTSFFLPLLPLSLSKFKLKGGGGAGWGKEEGGKREERC